MSKIIHLNKLFHYFHHRFWGTPKFLETPTWKLKMTVWFRWWVLFILGDLYTFRMLSFQWVDPQKNAIDLDDVFMVHSEIRVVVSNIFYFHPYLREDEPILTSIFFKWVGSTTNQKMVQRKCYLPKRHFFFCWVLFLPMPIASGTHGASLPRCWEFSFRGSKDQQ